MGAIRMTTKDDLRRRVEETRKKLASGNVGYVNTDWFFVDDVLEAFGLACMKVAYEDAARIGEQRARRITLMGGKAACLEVSDDIRQKAKSLTGEK